MDAGWSDLSERFVFRPTNLSLVVSHYLVTVGLSGKNVV
jgi:hypothetical protein